MEGSRLFLTEGPKEPGRRAIPRHAVFMKSIELFLAGASLMTYSTGAGGSCLHVRYAVASASFGAFVIVGTISLIGYLLAQPMPRILQITSDGLAFMLLFSSGMLMVESWWQFEISALESAEVTTEGEIHSANARLGAGLLAVTAAAFHLADALINVIQKEFI